MEADAGANALKNSVTKLGLFKSRAVELENLWQWRFGDPCSKLTQGARHEQNLAGGGLGGTAWVPCALVLRGQLLDVCFCANNLLHLNKRGLSR